MHEDLTMSIDVLIPYIVMNRLSDLRKTRQLFHEDPYMRSFESKVLEAVEANGNVFVVLEETCFHPQGGGQPADTGHIEGENSKLEVLDTHSIGGVIVHISKMELGEIRVDDLLRGEISWNTRYTYMKQHTASHIVFSSVQRILKIDNLQYMGFELGKEKARMDINYGKPISPEELRGIETFSNTICLESRPVKNWQTTREEAERTYGDRLGLTDVTPAGKVRVVEVQDWDTSLCSGTHVGSTSECTPIRILGRFRLQKGVERLEFTSGKAAFQYIERDLETLNQLGRLLSIPVEKLSERVKRLVEDTKTLKDEVRYLRAKIAEREALDMLKDAESVDGFKVIAAKVQDADIDTLKRITFTMTKQDPSIVVVLGSTQKNAYLIGRAGSNALERGLSIADILREAAEVIDGAGGGKADLAQAGGSGKEKLDLALKLCSEKIRERLGRRK